VIGLEPGVEEPHTAGRGLEELDGHDPADRQRRENDEQRQGDAPWGAGVRVFTLRFAFSRRHGALEVNAVPLFARPNCTIGSDGTSVKEDTRERARC